MQESDPDISFETLKFLALKSKEERNDEILKILSDGAFDQVKYMYNIKDYKNIMLRDEEKGFFEF